MTENKQIGRTPIQVIQIEQDFCRHRYGEAPCTAVLEDGGNKCYNTINTCQDLGNYELGDPLLLNFVNNQAKLPTDGQYYLPLLTSAKVTPGSINPGYGS